MLSRVIGQRDVAGVNASPFTAAPLSRNEAAPPEWSHGPSGLTDAPATEHLLGECARLTAANQVLADSVRSLESQLITVQNDAFETGRRQGQQQAQLDFAPVAEKMKQSIIDTFATRAEARRQAEGDVVELAQRIARRVLHREIATDPSSLAALAKVVFDRMTRAESYTLTINPQFLAAVQSVLTSAQSSKVRIEPDSGCAIGTFIIKSAEGTLDASIDTQLEEISRGLADRLSQD